MYSPSYKDRLIYNFRVFRNLFQGLPFIYASREAISILLQKIFRLQYRKSYAEKGEDLILAAMLDKVSCGFYVEVGCYHPICKSNTFGFYELGWRGLVVDANPVYLDAYRHIRPQDIVVEAAVSNGEYETELVCYQESAYSTISLSFATRFTESATGKKFVRRVKTRTLTSILDEYKAPVDFNLLSIDCEGHDFEVLQSLDLVRYHPEIIIIEDCDFSVAQYEKNPIVNYLGSYGYNLTAFCLNNLFFHISSSREKTNGSKGINTALSGAI